MKPAARFFLKLQELHKNRRLFLSIGYYYHMYVYKPKLNLYVVATVYLFEGIQATKTSTSLYLLKEFSK